MQKEYNSLGKKIEGLKNNLEATQTALDIDMFNPQLISKEKGPEEIKKRSAISEGVLRQRSKAT